MHSIPARAEAGLIEPEERSVPMDRPSTAAVSGEPFMGRANPQKLQSSAEVVEAGLEVRAQTPIPRAAEAVVAVVHYF